MAAFCQTFPVRYAKMVIFYCASLNMRVFKMQEWQENDIDFQKILFARHQGGEWAFSAIPDR
jgi:hypothetical protein